jgi:hypothetical protein
MVDLGGWQFLMSEVPLYAGLSALGLRCISVKCGAGKSPGGPDLIPASMPEEYGFGVS